MSQLRVDEIRANDGLETTEVSIPGLDQRFAAAWVNFSGTGVPTIRDNYNVDSITDNGTGNYTANFTDPLNNANYSVSVSSGAGGTRFASPTESGVTIITENSSGSPIEVGAVCLSVFSS